MSASRTRQVDDQERRCGVCCHLVELADPADEESWVHAEDGDWGDHTAAHPLTPRTGPTVR